MLWRAKSTLMSTNLSWGKSGTPNGGDAGGTVVSGGRGGRGEGKSEEKVDW